MPALILDTSTERGIVAIIHDADILFHADLPFGLQNSQFLLPEIHRGLTITKLKIHDLSFVGVGVGPGSYTGIRVGATVAKTLAFACQIPLVGVSSLDAFIPSKPASFAAVIDAKIGGVYLRIGRSNGDEVKFTTKPEVHSIPSAMALLNEVDVLVTPNAAQLRPKFESESHSGKWEWLERYPSPSQMARVANTMVANKEYSLDGHLDLLYLRKTQAEIEKEARK